MKCPLGKHVGSIRDAFNHGRGGNVQNQHIYRSYDQYSVFLPFTIAILYIEQKHVEIPLDREGNEAQLVMERARQRRRAGEVDREETTG